mmetsp:Transcript_6241/g.21422  ORF Transcript_6241/g.21422 Transcript_6241/m.21422 type:complete len:158 (-) Transcript_6241:459-932(-)
MWRQAAPHSPMASWQQAAATSPSPLGGWQQGPVVSPPAPPAVWAPSPARGPPRGVPVNFLAARLSSTSLSPAAGPPASPPPRPGPAVTSQPAAVTNGEGSEIRDFMRELGLEHYAGELEGHEVTVALLPTLGDQELSELGVTSRGARLRVMQAAKYL